MNFKSIIITACFFVAFLKYNNLYAQQGVVDSIATVAKAIAVSSSVDTVNFGKLIKRVQSLPLNNSDVTTLDNAAAVLQKGNNGYWEYRMKLAIMNSLVITDKQHAISYGRNIFETVKASKLIDANYISSTFFRELRLPYRNSKQLLPEGIRYFSDKLKEFKLAGDTIGITDCYYVLGGFYRTLGLIDLGIYNMKKSMSYMDTTLRTDLTVIPFYNPAGRASFKNNTSVLGIYYLQKGDYQTSLYYSMMSYKDPQKMNEGAFTGNIPAMIAFAKIYLGHTDSVDYYLDMAIKNNTITRDFDFVANGLQAKALYQINQNEFREAERSLEDCWKLIHENNFPALGRPGTLAPDYYSALIRIKQNRIPEAIELLKKDMERVKNSRFETLRDYKLMGELTSQTGDYAGSAKYYHEYILLQDSMQAEQDLVGSISYETEQAMTAKELSISKLKSENKISTLTRNFSFGIIALVAVLAGLIYYRFRSKQKANAMLERTLSDLKATQTQLIQSEKMASLGELTAGIAHEIQNPLNFVNNFSEVNKELAAELQEELGSGNIQSAKEITEDIKNNSEKINHHGKRADAIVKGMLQHSQAGKGQKELTDINALADEYLRLAYHGLRAKDKSFNANLKTDFDETIGKINIIPQDIGRVFLNLITNAFYAVGEKSKPLSAALAPTAVGNITTYFEPTVSIKTTKSDNRVFVSVSDNGNGIPFSIIDKIFQPFFTTKPTGQGTGLGLSLAYDIVKAHGGELKVETKENKGTTFIIELPVTS
jgi:signal transduction histidine kinase